MAAVHQEQAFEEAVEAAMLDSGWHRGQRGSYDRSLGLDTAEMFTFIGATQAEEWERLRAFYGDDANEAQRQFARLAHVLRKRRDAAVDLGQVDLTHLRIGKTGDYDLDLSPEGEGMLPGFTGGGPGARHEPPRTSLAELIADLNERFGSNLGQEDLVSGAVKDAMAVPQVQRAALANEDEENFGHVFDDVFEDKLYERIENDTKAMQQYADDPDFNAEIKSRARRYAYESLRRDVA